MMAHFYQPFVVICHAIILFWLLRVSRYSAQVKVEEPHPSILQKKKIKNEVTCFAAKAFVVSTG